MMNLIEWVEFKGILWIMFCFVVYFVLRYLRLFDYKCIIKGIKELILFYSNVRCVGI